MFRRLQTRNILPIALLIFAVCFVVGYIGHGQGFTSYNSTIFTIASFIFGIFISFSISNSSNRLNRISELLKTHDSNLLLIYKMVEEFDKAKLSKCRELIDLHLQDEIDFKLYDFHMSAGSFYRLYDFIDGLEPKTNKQGIVYEQLLGVINNMAHERQQLEVMVRQRISSYEWFCILTLLGIVIFYILSINNGKLFEAFLSSLLIIPMVVLTLVLQTLNNLRWEEDTQIWEPLERLCINLGLLPYFPEAVILDDRYEPMTKGKVRICQQPDVYPDMTHKKIIIKNIEDLPNLERSY